MSYPPMLVVHIVAGTTGLLSGAVAMSFRKGSRRHKVAGDVFVISMLALGASAAYLAVFKGQVGNFFGGLYTVYLVGTAWSTARNGEMETSAFDWAGLALVTALGGLNATIGVWVLRTPSQAMFGRSAGGYFFSALIALLYASSDLRMLMRGGIAGIKRVKRHLWRMCFAWFVASGSIFIARPHLFPGVLRRTHLLLLLGFLPLLLMIFWLVRVSGSRTKIRPLKEQATAYAART